MRLNTWQGSLRCKCQGCGGCLRLAKREHSTPRSKGLWCVHTTMTWDATPTSLSLIGMVSYHHQMNIKFLNLRMFGQGPSGRSKSAPNTFDIWPSNARGCMSSTKQWSKIAFTAWCGLDPIHRQQYIDSTMRWIIVAFAAWCGPDPSVASDILISLRWHELWYDAIHLSKDHVYVLPHG